MNKENEPFSFWDLIAQEAYLPQSDELRIHTWELFREREAKKRVWIFACNEATKELVRICGEKWNIQGILDNSKVIQGKDFCGIRVYSPAEIVPTLSAERDVIIISLRLNADIVYKQISEMRFDNIYSLGVLIAGIEPYKTFVEEISFLKEHSELSDTVLMESMNDFDGNTGALYEYLKANDSNHEFVWICKSESSTSAYFGGTDKKLLPFRSLEDLKDYIRVRATARWEIWECDPIRKVRDDQVNVFLQHYGMGYKQVAHLYNSPWYVDYVLTTTELVRKMEEKAITYAPTSKFVYGELPRNDVLKRNDWNELSKITEKNYDKVIMWAPTLRESRYFNREDSDISHPFGVSLIYEKKQMDEVNDYLKHHNMLLVIKIHPRQKINFEETDYSNLVYIDGVKSKEIHGYKLMTQMDALITDYSSIVFDYMLLDRPIAWVLEDRPHYKIEYLMDNPDEYMPGEKMYDLKDLFQFFDNVSNGVDLYKSERREICARCNQPFEGKGSEHLQEVFNL